MKMQEGKWLASSGATVHIINSDRYSFKKTIDRSTIVVGAGKET